MVLIVPPMLVKWHIIRTCNPKSIVMIRIKPFQSSVLTHKSCLEYMITCGTNILLLPNLNPRTKNTHLYIIGLGSVQRINNLIEKYIHLATLKIIVTPKIYRRAKICLSTPGLLLHAGSIYQ